MGKMHEVNIYCTIWALKAVKVLEFPPETKNNWLKKKVFLKKKESREPKLQIHWHLIPKQKWGFVCKFLIVQTTQKITADRFGLSWDYEITDVPVRISTLTEQMEKSGMDGWTNTGIDRWRVREMGGTGWQSTLEAVFREGHRVQETLQQILANTGKRKQINFWKISAKRNR